MDFKHSQPMKIISIIVLVFFTWTFGGGFDLAYAAKNSSQHTVDSRQGKTSASADQPKAGEPEEKFQKAIEDITNTVEEVGKIGRLEDEKKGKLKTKKTEIEGLDGEIRKQFKETEEKIKDLPEVIKQRHKDFVKKYEDNLNELKTNLDNIEKAKNKAEADAAIEKVKAHLEKVKPPKKHVPLDPNKLPHRTVEPVEVPMEEIGATGQKSSRIEDSSQYTVDSRQEKANRQKPILVASIGSLAGILSSAIPQVTNAPSPADLAETIEIQFTPEIAAKAEELQNNPVKIYNWVRNNIEFVPTYGSIQGANMCLQTKQCNDFDTASLLIALFRASNIPAKYVYGTIELPIEKVKNWVGGFTDSMEALRLLASAGIPTKGMTVGGEIKYVRIEHVWVDAWIDYIPSRGARHKTGQGDTWIPLDASFKQYNYTQGIDIKTAVPFDAESFINQIQSTATINETEGYVTGVDSLFINQTMTDYQTQVQNYISQNYPNATVGDVLGKKEIIKQEFPILAGTLPYKRIVTGTKYSNIPDNKRHKINFNVKKDMYDEIIGTPITITKSLPELAGKKITLSYSPATPQDEAVINSYLPKPHTDGTPIQPSELPSSLPAYLINLKPELRIDGSVVATGTHVGMGNTETFTMTFSGPGQNANDVIKNDIEAGEYLGIALDLGRISGEQMQALKTKLEATKAKLEAQDFTSLTKDDILGDLLSTTALSYYAELDVMDFVSAKTMGVAAIRLPSETIFSYELKVNKFFGSPISAGSGGLAMDLDRAMTLVKSLNGNKEKSKQFMLTSGMNGSALEHSVPEQLFSTPDIPAEGVSAVKALQLANDQGIPVYTINQTNINTILPQLQLDSGTIADIQNAVNAGKEVKISKTDITYNGWIGCGYIITDPNTGAGAYMISGGMNGSWLYWVGFGFLVTAIVAIGLICLLSGVCAAIAAGLTAVFGTIAAGLDTIMLWLAAGASVGWFYLSQYVIGSFLVFIFGVAWECLVIDPDPDPLPDKKTAYCTFIMTSIFLTILSWKNTQ